MKTTRRADSRAGFSLVTGALVAAVILVAAACGLAAAYALSGGQPRVPGEAKAGDGAEEPSSLAYEFIPFGPAMVNLAEGRLTRMMRVDITLQVKKEVAPAVKKLLESDAKAVFTDWLVTHLSDKQLKEVSGTTAINRLRREIQDGFNAILADKGDGRIDSVLFGEFLVQ